MSLPGMDDTLSDEDWFSVCQDLFGKADIRGGKPYKFGADLVDIRGNKVHKIGDRLIEVQGGRVHKIGNLLVERNANRNIVKIGSAKITPPSAPSANSSSSKPSSSSNSNSNNNSFTPSPKPVKRKEPVGGIDSNRPDLILAALRQFMDGESYRPKDFNDYPDPRESVDPMHKFGPGIEFNGVYVSPSGRMLRFYPDDKQYRVLYFAGPSKALDNVDYLGNCESYGFSIRSLEGPNKDPWRKFHDAILAPGTGMTLQHDPKDPNMQRGQLKEFDVDPNFLRLGIRPIKADFTTNFGDRNVTYHKLNANWSKNLLKVVTDDNFAEPLDAYLAKTMPRQPAEEYLNYHPWLRARYVYVESDSYLTLSGEDRENMISFLKSKRDLAKFESNKGSTEISDPEVALTVQRVKFWCEKLYSRPISRLSAEEKAKVMEEIGKEKAEYEAAGKPWAVSASGGAGDSPQVKPYVKSKRLAQVERTAELRTHSTLEWGKERSLNFKMEGQVWRNKEQEYPNITVYNADRVAKFNTIPTFIGHESDEQISTMVDRMVTHIHYTEFFFLTSFPKDAPASELYDNSYNRMKYTIMFGKPEDVDELKKKMAETEAALAKASGTKAPEASPATKAPEAKSAAKEEKKPKEESKKEEKKTKEDKKKEEKKPKEEKKKEEKKSKDDKKAAKGKKDEDDDLSLDLGDLDLGLEGVEIDLDGIDFDDLNLNEEGKEAGKDKDKKKSDKKKDDKKKK